MLLTANAYLLVAEGAGRGDFTRLAVVPVSQNVSDWKGNSDRRERHSLTVDCDAGRFCSH